MVIVREHLSPMLPAAAEQQMQVKLTAVKKNDRSEPSRVKEFVGKSPAVRRLLREARLAAQGSDSPILITGPVGSGKSHLARYIHQHSARAEGPLAFVDCGTLPQLENNLFGHRRGAFTGAERNLDGLLQSVHGGILVLDDVERLDRPKQDLLHRVVVDGVFRPVGSGSVQRVDIRFLATTNVDLTVAVREGTLAADFLSRLSYHELRVPPLQQRREDLPGLCRELLERNYQKLVRKGIIGAREIVFDDACWPGLMARTFVDNVRGLDKLMVRLLAYLEERTVIRPRDIDAVAPVVSAAREPWFDQPKPLRLVREAAEREYIIQVCRHTRFNLRAAARALDISPKCLYAKLKQYGITRP